MDHKENQTPGQQRRQSQIAELIRNTWGFGKDFSVNEVKHVLGILSVNSFVVHDGSEVGMDLIGRKISFNFQLYSSLLSFPTLMSPLSFDKPACAVKL